MTTVAEYLSLRIKNLGVDHLFSIPGNYTAEFLLAADKCGIECIGTTNELEAGYAADAYSRYRKLGVCSATYGVGTHSLYNAISGAYVEFCPVVLINGSPPPIKFENLRNRGILFAHAIDPIRTDQKIFEEVTVASTVIEDPYHAPAEIDRVLLECLRQSRPVYIEVLQGIWYEECESPVGELTIPEDINPHAELAARKAAEVIAERIRISNSPVLWGGELLQRRRLTGQFEKLVEQTEFPYTTTLMGKGLIPENKYPNQFIGVYDSKFAPTNIREVVENSDCIIALGTIMSDFYADIVINSNENLILASDDAVRVGSALYPNVCINKLLPCLLEELQRKSESVSLAGFEDLLESRKSSGLELVESVDSETGSTPVTYQSLFEALSNFLTQDMTLLVDTSLALFPSAEVPITRKDGYVAQTAWLSIGYTCGAALGVATAGPETKTIVVVGDGGFQMVPQSFSTLVKQNSDAIVIVLDNGTYGIEQYLVDMQILPEEERFFQNELPEASFFDVLPRWDYVKLAEAFGGKGVKVSTQADLVTLLANSHKGPVLVGLTIDQHNLPVEIYKTTLPTSESTSEILVAGFSN